MCCYGQIMEFAMFELKDTQMNLQEYIIFYTFPNISYIS